MPIPLLQRRFPKPRPIAIDLFCGAGGMSLGFEQAGFDVVLGVDVDGHHVATHARNFPYGKALCASIVNLDGKRVREIIDDYGEIDVVVGGPPCQGFSNMGLRDQKDPRNSLIDHFIRLILELRPRAFVMENVPGMMAGDTRKILDAVIETTRRGGYHLTLPVRVLDAADFGVPQQRKRLFLLGVRKDVAPQIAYPIGTCESQPARPTVWEAIADLPDIEDDDVLFRRNNALYKRRPKSIYARVARGVAIDLSDLSRPRDWDEHICTGCLRTRHSPHSVNLYAATPPGEVVPGHKLPRLHPDSVCTTLRAGSDSKHGSYTAPRPIHPFRPRCITSREAARLHGFPDWFAFYPLKWHAYRQIGNAVCPQVARAIGYSIRAALGGRSTKTSPPVIRLDDAFVLPDDRPRTLKRIPQIKQFPPVIGYLFEKAYNKCTGRMRKAWFTFDDVRKAVAATEVDLHWVREDTFLTEVARSRRVDHLLAPAMKFGFSIVPYSERGAIGKFVPLGTPGTIDQRDSLKIRIDEIRSADRLPMRSPDLNGTGWGVIAVLTQPRVQEKLWQRSDCIVGLLGEDNNEKLGCGNVYSLTIRHAPKFSPETSAVITCKAAALPTKSRIAKIGKERNAEKVTILVKATDRHVVAMQFAGCTSTPQETARAAFEFQECCKSSK